MRLRTFSHVRRQTRSAPVAAGDDRATGRSRRHPARGWLIALTVVAGVLLLTELLGGPVATALANRKLGRLEGYVGRVGAVDLAWWRGAVQLDDFTLRDRSHPDVPPVVQIHQASMRIAPLGLFRGKLGGAGVVDGVVVNLTKHRQVTPKEAANKAGEKLEKTKQEAERWQEALRNSFPVTLTRLEVKNGELRYVDQSHDPNGELQITGLHIVARDLQNRPKANGDPLPAKVQVDALMTGQGRLSAMVQANPIARQPTFAARFELRGLQLAALNSLLVTYVGAEATRGSFELFVEANAKNGGYDGYVKPLFHDLAFHPPPGRHENTVQKVKEIVAKAVTKVLKNPDKQQVATKAPFRGNFADNRVDVWTTIVELFHNAFIQALRGGFEGRTPPG